MKSAYNIELGMGAMQKLKLQLWTRRRVFIDPRAQLKFCIDLILHALALPLLVVVLLSVEPFSRLLTRGNHEASRAIVLQFVQVCIGNWWIVVLALVVLGFSGILFSHKMFGPIYGCTNNLRRIMNGDRDVHIGTRAGSYFKEFVETLKAFIASSSRS